MKVFALRHCASAADLIIDMDLVVTGSLGSGFPLGTGLFGQESRPPSVKPKNSRASDFGPLCEVAYFNMVARRMERLRLFRIKLDFHPLGVIGAACQGAQPQHESVVISAARIDCLLGNDSAAE
ncbi:MAG TPA: hypothetical protein VJN69_03065 [Candidatus Acidoferrales bacterium]|nr:hypothetical protein [Candidatus Acidoferrales bacterium]